MVDTGTKVKEYKPDSWDNWGKKVVDLEECPHCHSWEVPNYNKLKMMVCSNCKQLIYDD